MNDVESVVKHLIIPPLEAEKLVSQSGSVYLRDCPCRVEMKNCSPDKWDVCILFGSASEEDRQHARLISTKEAMEIIKETTERGEIHQLFYFDEGDRPYELCNCCSCCCFPLREARDKGDNFQSLQHSGYVAVTDPESCVGCGDCVDVCFFGARRLEDYSINLVDERCFGCAVCVSTCPEEAIHIDFQVGRGIQIPS